MKEYKIAKGWVIFIFIFGPGLIIVFSMVLLSPWLPFMEDDIAPGSYWIFALMSVAMILLMLAGIRDTIRSRLVIGNDKITLTQAFSHKELLFGEIAGFKTGDKYILILSKNPEKKKMKITNYFGGYEEIKRWLSANFVDLDQMQGIQDFAEIVSSDEFGRTTEEREGNLIVARRITKILNGIGGLMAVWLFFFPAPYNYVMLASVIFPIVCLVILRYYNGLIKLEKNLKSPYPSILWALLVSCSVLCIRSLIDFNIYDSGKIWLPAAIIAVSCTLIAGLGNREFDLNRPKNFGLIIVFLGLMFGYGYGSVVSLNCIMDNSEPEIYGATVLDKHTSSGKYTSYYLELASWGPRRMDQDVSVSKKLYQEIDPGDPITIIYMQGKFNIPWFEVSN